MMKINISFNGIEKSIRKKNLILIFKFFLPERNKPKLLLGHYVYRTYQLQTEGLQRL